RLCRALAELKDEGGRMKDEGPDRSAPLHPSSFILHPSQVDRLVAGLFFSHRARERDNNLIFVRERLLRATAPEVGVDTAGLLGLYARVRAGFPRARSVRDDEGSPLVSALRLSGIVKAAPSHPSFVIRHP